MRLISIQFLIEVVAFFVVVVVARSAPDQSIFISEWKRISINILYLRRYRSIESRSNWITFRKSATWFKWNRWASLDFIWYVSTRVAYNPTSLPPHNPTSTFPTAIQMNMKISRLVTIFRVTFRILCLHFFFFSHSFFFLYFVKYLFSIACPIASQCQ